MTPATASLAASWHDIAPVLSVRNAREYKAAVARLDALLDDGAQAARHPLHGLLHALGLAMRAYEESRIPIADAPPRDVLALLMQQHRLRQSDLSDVAPQSVISELLSGRRDFNVRHVAALSRRFGVPAEAFIPAEFTDDDDSAGARETRYLLSNPANARRLAASLAELDAGKGKPRGLVEPRQGVREQRATYARKRPKPGAKPHRSRNS